jgi:hypothetical protein
MSPLFYILNVSYIFKYLPFLKNFHSNKMHKLSHTHTHTHHYIQSSSLPYSQSHLLSSCPGNTIMNWTHAFLAHFFKLLYTEVHRFLRVVYSITACVSICIRGRIFHSASTARFLTQRDGLEVQPCYCMAHSFLIAFNSSCRLTPLTAEIYAASFCVSF